MGYQIAWDAMNLRPTPRVAHTEYCDHHELIKHVTGEDAHWGTGKFCDAWDVDFMWNTHDGCVDWGKAGRLTDMGHATYVDGGTDFVKPHECPFHDPEEVLAFDAVKEYGLADMDTLTAHFQKQFDGVRKAYPNQLVTGGYYRTMVSGAIASFGWDMLLMAAADARRFEKVIDSFFRYSLHNARAWARTSIEVFITHDDMVWSQGAFLHPDFYRQVLFPRYAEIWKELHKAGKKVLFCSDGDWRMFIDDIAQAGADGFIFEPMIPLEAFVKKYGKTHAIFGSKSDCRTLSFKTKHEIQAEIDATLELAMDCPGFFYAVGNHMPANIPLENALFYIDYLRQHWTRK